MLLDTVQNKSSSISQREMVLLEYEAQVCNGIVGVQSSGFLCQVLPLSYFGLFTHVPQKAISESFFEWFHLFLLVWFCMLAALTVRQMVCYLHSCLASLLFRSPSVAGSYITGSKLEQLKCSTAISGFSKFFDILHSCSLNQHMILNDTK